MLSVARLSSHPPTHPRKLPPRAALAILLAMTIAAGVASAAPQPAATPPWHEQLDTLLSRIVPDNGPARPPFVPARYDLWLQPQVKHQHNELACLARRAAQRQEALQAMWEQLKTDRAETLSPTRRAQWKTLEYAFGECLLEDAQAAAQRAGAAERFRLARLLLAECRFGDAVKLLVALADEAPAADASAEISGQALALLVRHQVERDALGRQVMLVPPSFDLFGYLERRAQDPSTRNLITGLRQTISPQTSRSPDEEIVIEEELFEEELPDELFDEDVLDEPPDHPDTDISRFYTQVPLDELPAFWEDIDRPLLATTGHELTLFQKQHGWIDPGSAVFTLDTIFHGPLRFRIYRFAKRAEWDLVTGSVIAKTKPYRTWTRTFLPLNENNRAEPQSRDVAVDGLPEGYYLLTVEARYAPMLGACKFCVNDVALYVRTCSNQAVVVAVDRSTGRPAGDVPLQLTVQGTPDLDRLRDQFDVTHKGLFRAGFDGRPAPPFKLESIERSDNTTRSNSDPQDRSDPAADTPAPTPDTPAADPSAGPPDSGDEDPFAARSDGGGEDPFGSDPFGDGDGLPFDPFDDSSEARRLTDRDAAMRPADVHLKSAEIYARGAEARQRYPDFEQVHRLTTGADGAAAVPLDLARPDYRYTLVVERVAGQNEVAGLSRVQIEYQHPQARPKTNKVVVWLAQPVHRPGTTAHFKGIVRSFDGTVVYDHQSAAKRSVEVIVRHRKSRESLWEGTCEVSAAGTFHGSFPIPLGAPLGRYNFQVDGSSATPSTPLVVAEFRLPTYRVDLQTASRNQPGGESLRAEVAVQYFTGKPATDAEVELALETGNVNPPTRFALTDKTGKVAIDVPLPQVDKDRRFVLRATVMDAAGQTYTCIRTIYVMANPFQLSVSARPGEVRHGDEFDVEVRARRWTDKPIAGAVIAIDGVRSSLLTDAAGRAKTRLRAPQEGSQQMIRVTAIADRKLVVDERCRVRLRPRPKDKEHEGSSQTDAGQAASGGSSTKSQQDTERPSLSFVSFPDSVDAGQPLQFAVRVKGPAGREATLALFAENSRLLKHRTLRVTPGLHRVTLSTRPDWAPSLRMTAVLLDGRAARTAERSGYLRPREKLITVNVATDREEYRPGDECVAVVTATDHKGNPVPHAEISLGVVDEAIYNVHEDPTPNLQRFFYAYHLPYLGRGKYDAEAPPVHRVWYWLGPRYAWGDWPLVGRYHGGGSRMSRFGGGSYGCKVGKQPQYSIRRDFQTTAHWVADLMTDAEGKARTRFQLPDNMTSWRLTARSVTTNTCVGEVHVSRRALSPLQIELALPRGLRQGDRIQLPVTLHNNTDRSRLVAGMWRIGESEQQPWPERPLPAKGDAAFTVPLAPGTNEPLPVFAAVHEADGDAGDAIERRFQPLPAGYPVERAYSGTLAETAVIEPELGGQLTEHGLAISIRREPGVAGAVQSALDDLIDYPYGCVEQTMSRFAPALIAAEAMRSAGIDNPATEKLPEVFGRSLAKLQSYQHADGGWGWWQNDATNDFMTSYVVEGLARCRQLDHPVPINVISGGAQHLARRLREGTLSGRRPGSMIHVRLPICAAHALATLYSERPSDYAQGCREVENSLTSIGRENEPLTTLDRILLADTWRLLGHESKARTMLPDLINEVAIDRRDRYSMVTAASLLALGVKLQPDAPRWPQLARQLVAARRGTSWGDTLTNSAVVRGLAGVMRESRDQPIPVLVKIDGRQVGVLKGNETPRIDLQVDHLPKISLQPTKPGSSDFYAVRLKGYLESPPEPLARPAVTLRTRVFVLRPKHHAAPVDASGRVEVPRGATLQVQIEAELTRAVSHTRLTMPRPCGVELVRSPRPSAGVVASEERDESLNFFIEHWDKGTHRIEFLVRAEVAGTVASPLPELVPMYDDTPSTAAFGPTVWSVQGADSPDSRK